MARKIYGALHYYHCLKISLHHLLVLQDLPYNISVTMTYQLWRSWYGTSMRRQDYQ